MMGERTVAQEALFYSFNLIGMFRLITCYARSTGSSTCRASPNICAPSTVRLAGPQLIPS